MNVTAEQIEVLEARRDALKAQVSTHRAIQKRLESLGELFAAQDYSKMADEAQPEADALDALLAAHSALQAELAAAVAQLKDWSDFAGTYEWNIEDHLRHRRYRLYSRTRDLLQGHGIDVVEQIRWNDIEQARAAHRAGIGQAAGEEVHDGR